MGESAGPHGATGPEGDVSGPVVLVIDDDPGFGEIVAACLGFEGAEVLVVGTLAAARDALHADLHGIVIDPRLPDGDGLTVLADIEVQCPETVVVVCAEAGLVPEHGRRRVIDKSDLAALVDALGLEPDHIHFPTDRLIHVSALADDIAEMLAAPEGDGDGVDLDAETGTDGVVRDGGPGTPAEQFEPSWPDGLSG